MARTPRMPGTRVRRIGQELYSDREALTLREQPSDWKPRARPIPSFGLDPYEAADGIDPANAALGKYLQALLDAVHGKTVTTPIYGTVGTEAALIVQGNGNRSWLFIQNLDAANVLYVGVGYSPTEATGLRLGSQGIAFEPAKVPIEDIYLLGSAGDTDFLVITGVPALQEGV